VKESARRELLVSRIAVRTRRGINMNKAQAFQ
jgi:hypothetical protein